MNYRSCLLTSGVSVVQFCAYTSPSFPPSLPPSLSVSLPLSFSLSLSLSLTHSHTRTFQHGGGQGDAGQCSLQQADGASSDNRRLKPLGGVECVGKCPHITSARAGECERAGVRVCAWPSESAAE